MEEAKGGGGGTACFQVVGPGTSLMSMDTSPGGVTISHDEEESEGMLALADMDTQPIPGRKRFRPGPEEASTPIKVKDPPPEENNDKENCCGAKKLASDADYSTPKRVKSESTSGIYFSGAIVKRRLNFDAVALMEGDTSSGDSWTTSSKTVEEEEEEDRQFRHNKKKKRRRHHHHHVSSKVVQVIGQDGEPVRKIIASKSGSSTEINQGEGVEGKKEEETASKEETKCQGPPRRIAQLVVWTKPKEISGEGKEGKKEFPPGGKRKASSKIKEPPKEAEQVCAHSSTTSGCTSEVVEGSSGQAEKEGDLFFVQYPARPFSDQGKGRGKPFRRLNSYNDPIVIKKTPPPPPPCQPKRRKVGEKRKRVGKKSKAQVVTVENNLGFLEQHQAAYRAYLEQAYPQQQQQQLQEYNLAQLWPPPQQQPGGTEGQPQFVQEYYQCTLPLQGELGEVITLPLQVPQEQGTVEVIVPAEYTIQPQQQQPQVLEETSVDKKEEGDGIMGEGSGQSSSGGEGTVFELPERFTVTTEGQNEFDLLIQNVVHEELVNGGLSSTEEELGERGRKRMRLEDGGGDEEAVSSGGEERVASGGGGNGNGSEEEGKPRCTYTELIEKALTESGGLTVSEIYNWISERYPYYKQDDDRWKNSVRHNLSINPYFKKGEKARSGAGHLWTISEESKGLRPSMVSGSWDERRKSPCDPGELLLSMDNETDRAVANILGMYRSKMEAEKGGGSKENEESLEEPPAPPEKPVVVQEQAPTTDSYCVTTTTSAATSQPVASSMITLNQLNTGQFTVDLSGITIPDGGTINFDELVSNGRLIYIETSSSTSATNQDPEANKENEQHQSSLLHHHTDSLLSELASAGGQNGPVVTSSGAGGPVLGEEEANNLNRFGGSYFQDLDFGSASVSSGKGDHHGALQHHFEEFATSSSSAVGMVTTLTNSGLTMVPPSEVVPVSSSSGGSAQDYGILESLTGAGGENSFSGEFLGGSTSEANYHQHLPPSGITAAMYESKELGIPYTFQTEGLQQPQQQQHLHHNQHSHLLRHPDLLQ